MGEAALRLVEGGEGLGIDLPGGGRAGAGRSPEITGEGVLSSFLEGIPKLPERDEAPLDDDGPPQRWAPPMSKEEGYEAIPEQLEGTDRLKHENDILFITNYALEKGGVSGMADFVDWMHRQLALARRSGFFEKPHKMAPDIPEVEVLSRYLRQVSQYAQRSF